LGIFQDSVDCKIYFVDYCKINFLIYRLPIKASVILGRHWALEVLQRSLFVHLGPLYQPLEDVIRLKLIPALTGHGACSALEWNVFSLSCRLDGLGIVNPVDIADFQFTASIKITQSLRSLIVAQNLQAPLPDVSCIKAQIHQDRCYAAPCVSTIRSNLPLPSLRDLDLNSEPGASSWLTALPLGERDSI